MSFTSRSSSDDSDELNKFDDQVPSKFNFASSNQSVNVQEEAKRGRTEDAGRTTREEAEALVRTRSQKTETQGLKERQETGDREEVDKTW